jgi:uncharacterized membrane protein
MTKRQLLAIIDSDRVQNAVERAENCTSGEIVVSVSGIFWGDVEQAARRAFARLGIANTRRRNGILIFVVPSRRRFMVLGDTGIHQSAGPDFWLRVAAGLSADFHRGNFTDGLVTAIETIGEQLAAHFPCDPATDRNELADKIDLAG